MTAECKPVQVPSFERLRALENWLQKTKTKLIRINGQRKYGGPPEVWDGPTPGANCEIFICRIPREAYEDLLIPLFSSVAPLWEFRLMMNFSGQNRGFAFAKYGSPAIVAEAIRQLDGHVLEPGYRLLVCRSTEKKHLCIWDLPAKTTQEYLLQVLRKMVDGVENVSLRTGRGRASALVAFSSHHAASMANKVLTEAFKKQFGLTVSIKWKTIRERVNEDREHEKWFPKNPFPEEPVPEKPVPEEPVSEEPVPEEPCCSQKPAASPSPLKPQQYLPKSPQPSVPPPCLSHSVSFTPVFCKVVGGPAAPRRPKTSTQGPPGFTPVPVVVLYELCLLRGFGQPIYEIKYSHAGQDGFLYFFYNVYVPGITAPFRGLIAILPGPDASIMLEEAQAAAAQQVLQKFTA